MSKSFVTCKSMINFSSLRLENSIQFLYTSSVLIGLEFVLSNLRLTVSEDLLPLSVQESPNLFILRVLSQNFLSARHKSANNKFPRSIVTD